MSINKIPVQLWCDIVELCDWKVSWRLSQVNKHFRGIMLSTPIPWKRLDFDLPDFIDDNDQKRFDEWAIEFNRRSGNSMKHITLEVAAVIYEDQGIGPDYLLRHFTAMDNFTLKISRYGSYCGYLLECPEAKHVHAYANETYDSSHREDWTGPEPHGLLINESVESVNCSDIILGHRDRHSPQKDLSLKSAILDFTNTYDMNWHLLSVYDHVDDETYMFSDSGQFEVISYSKQLESLKVAYTDGDLDFGFKGLSLPSLKFLSVQKSRCRFLVNGDLPALESLTLIDCRRLRPETQSVFNNCMIKHLNLIETITPSFSFNQACIVSLSLQSSSRELERLMNGSGFANFTSLKALNVSFTGISLDEVLFIVGQVNLEQLLCDLPETRNRDDCAALESAIAKLVPHYWTRNQQYYKDIKTNNDLEQYFFHYRKADADVF